MRTRETRARSAVAPRSSNPRAASPADRSPFAKGARVVLTYGGYSGVHGSVTHAPVYKTRPKGGKTPGWWLHVELDKEPGIKSWWVEIHASHAVAEA